MEKRKHTIRLTEKERKELKSIVSKGKSASRTIMRATVLLNLDSDAGQKCDIVWCYNTVVVSIALPNEGIGWNILEVHIVNNCLKQTKPCTMFLVETFRIDSFQINSCAVKMVGQKIFHLLKLSCMVARTTGKKNKKERKKECAHERTGIYPKWFPIHIYVVNYLQLQKYGKMKEDTNFNYGKSTLMWKSA